MGRNAFMNDYYFIQGIGFIDENLGWMGGNSSYPTFVTTDGGHNWSSADFGSRVNRLDFINNNIGFACGETIYKYTSNLGTFVKNELVKFPENPLLITQTLLIPPQLYQFMFLKREF